MCLFSGFNFESGIKWAFILFFAALYSGFFIKRKNFKLLIVFLVIYSFYIMLLQLNTKRDVSIPLTLYEIFIMLFVVVAAIVYQNEFKTLFFNLSRGADKRLYVSELAISDEDLQNTVKEIVKACQNMSKNRCGALIVVAPSSVSHHTLDTGIELNALVSYQLIESIFNTKSPFHDGAIIIKDNRVLAAGCFLPLSQNQNLDKNLGTRHRAGIGITEETDMLTIIVSEENGIISIARNGELRRFITMERLSDILYDTFKIVKTYKKKRF
ncbi:MAG: diadenylate cyclase [Christensenellales bacterium]|jgi:diadenylate cyclase